ncbi:MAG: CAP domain-containing protein [Patescibacteria group bacterium]
MPVKAIRKRHRVPGHTYTKHYVKTYWPYLPMILVVLVGLLFGGHPASARNRGVLAYATSVSIGGLLSSTNTQRAAAGAVSLTNNSQLNSAAQSKANDMVARNYWSHETPDGQQPWVFIQNAGYSYTKAGENLAYGFTTSSDTINGWMNSPSHKANMLDTAFTEVGFGFANSENFNSSGPSTVVVAMYGKPQVLASGSTNPTAAPAPVPAPKPKPVPAPAPVPAPVPVPAPTPIPSPTSVPKTEPAFTPAVASQSISRGQILTKGAMPWITFGLGLLSGVAILALLTRHSLALRHILRNSQRFVSHHPLYDCLIVSVLVLSTIMVQTDGYIL